MASRSLFISPFGLVGKEREVFYWKRKVLMKESESILSIEDLERIIQSRKEEMPNGSYVVSLFTKGADRIAQKVGEEGVEVAIAATRLGITGEGEKELVGEVADLCFHTLVLLTQLDIPFIRIREELTKRNAEKTLQK